MTEFCESCRQSWICDLTTITVEENCKLDTVECRLWLEVDGEMNLLINDKEASANDY